MSNILPNPSTTKYTEPKFIDFTIPPELEELEDEDPFQKIKYEEDEIDKEFERLFNDTDKLLEPVNTCEINEEEVSETEEFKVLDGLDGMSQFNKNNTAEKNEARTEVSEADKEQLEKELFNEIQESIQFEFCEFESFRQERITPESPEHKPFNQVFPAKEINVNELFSTINQLKDRISELEAGHTRSFRDGFCQTDFIESARDLVKGSEANGNDSLEVLKLKNNINTLESKILILERRLEYAQFVQKMAEEERDKLAEKIKQPRKSHIYRINYEPENSEFVKADESDFGIKKVKEPFNPPVTTFAHKKEYNKQQMKEELKRSFMESMKTKQTKKSHSSPKKPHKTELNVPESIPFIAGKSTSPSHNINSNLQMIKSLLKQLDYLPTDQLRILLQEVENECEHFVNLLKSLNKKVDTKTVEKVSKELQYLKEQSEKLRGMVNGSKEFRDGNCGTSRSSKALVGLCKLRDLKQMQRDVLEANGVLNDVLSSPKIKRRQRRRVANNIPSDADNEVVFINKN